MNIPRYSNMDGLLYRGCFEKWRKRGKGMRRFLYGVLVILLCVVVLSGQPAQAKTRLNKTIPASVNRYTAKPIAEKTKRRVAGYHRT